MSLGTNQPVFGPYKNDYNTYQTSSNKLSPTNTHHNIYTLNDLLGLLWTYQGHTLAFFNKIGNILSYTSTMVCIIRYSHQHWR